MMKIKIIKKIKKKNQVDVDAKLNNLLDFNRMIVTSKFYKEMNIFIFI